MPLLATFGNFGVASVGIGERARIIANAVEQVAKSILDVLGRALGADVGSIGGSIGGAVAASGIHTIRDIISSGQTRMAPFEEDFELAQGCARGDAEALARFEREFGPDLDRAVNKSPTLGVSEDEFRQLVRERLFVGTPERAPRIASYSGSGPLRSWVRVTATRLVVDLARKRPAEVARSDEELARRLPPAQDAELTHLRRAYGQMVPDAFDAALRGLTPRQRNLLRQRFLHELTVERMAAMYDVHRSTMFEWLGRARSDLVAGVRGALGERVPGHALESVVALLGSELDVSVRRMLDSKLESG